MAIKRTKQQKLIYYNNPRFYERTLEQMQEVEERIVWLLKGDEHYRNCDVCLMIGYWRTFDNVITNSIFSSERERHKLTPVESITRSRRIIQNTLGLFLPTDPEVIEKRGIREEAIKEWVRRFK